MLPMLNPVMITLSQHKPDYPVASPKLHITCTQGHYPHVKGADGIQNLYWIKPSPVILQELIWPKNGEWFFKFLYSNYNHCSTLRLLICLSILLIFVDFVSTAVCGDCEDCTLRGYLGYWIIQGRPSRSGKDLLKISRPGYF